MIALALILLYLSLLCTLFILSACVVSARSDR